MIREVDGWYEDFNEGPYDYLARRDGWEIFRNRDSAWKVTPPNAGCGSVALAPSLKAAKEYAYQRGCSRPEPEGGKLYDRDAKITGVEREVVKKVLLAARYAG